MPICHLGRCILAVLCCYSHGGSVVDVISMEEAVFLFVYSFPIGPPIKVHNTLGGSLASRSTVSDTLFSCLAHAVTGCAEKEVTVQCIIFVQCRVLFLSPEDYCLTAISRCFYGQVGGLG